MKDIKIAVQAFSVRHDVKKDLRGTLQALKDMGYEGVEMFGDYRDYDAAELKALFDEVGLAIVGWHTMMDALLGERFDETVKFHKAIGNKSVVVPWLDAPLNDEKVIDKAGFEKWVGYATQLNGIAGKLAEHGMFTGYHNHHFEFLNSFEGVTLFDAFFAEANEKVTVQFDTGNGAEGGADITEVVRKYKDRSTTIHFKPYSKTLHFDTMIGDETEVHDWKAVLELLRTGTTEWIIVEYESEKLYQPLEGVKLCLDGLKKYL